jgi:microcystin-dependent protein
MSVGLYSHTTRGTGTVLTASIYNSDHVNHITNQNPSMTGALADSVGEYQTNSDPGGVGSESLPPNLAGELERLRFTVKRIVGGPQWYSAPPISLTQLSLPVGGLLMWPTENIPAGTLLCNGQAVSRTTWPLLFAAYGTRYGPGDGSTTFNLPNYKDYFIRGHDASGTDAGSRTDRGDGTVGANVGTKQAGATKEHVHGVGTLATALDGAHTHGFTYDFEGNTTITGGGGRAQTIAQSGLDSLVTTQSGGAHTHTLTGSTATTGESANETRPKNITVNFICIAG